MPRVFIPPAIKTLTNDQAVVMTAGKSIREVIDDLERMFPGVRQRLIDGDELRPGMAVTVNGNVTSLGLLQRLDNDAEVHFLPAVGGG